MFQNLRNGSPFYILYKNELDMKIGEVIGVSTPIPQFGTTYQNGLLSPPKNFVDIKVAVNGEEITLQKLPSDVTIADFGNAGMVVSESKDAMLNELDAFQTISERALADTPKHEKIVSKCKEFKAKLNPSIAKEAEQAKEIEGLKAELADIKSMIKALGRSSK